LLLKNQVETFYKSTTNIKTEFCIDIDSLFKDDETGKMIPIWQWSGYSTKQRAINKIYKLKEGTDFLLNNNVKLQGSKTGQKINQYLFTKDGFKHFLLMSNTNRGQQIRNYFIDVEKRYGREIAEATPFDKAILKLTGVLDKFNDRIETNSFANTVNTQAITEHTQEINNHEQRIQKLEKSDICRSYS
jgi:phage anti-repressor protein